MATPDATGEPRQWATGFWDCWKDEETCWWSFWCPCLISGRTSHQFGIDTSGRNCTAFTIALLLFFLLVNVAPLAVTLLFLIYVIGTRISARLKVRSQLEIAGDAGNDIAAHVCCSCFALAQEAREAKSRGLPAIDFCTGESLERGDDATPVAGSAQRSFVSELSSVSRFSKLLLANSGLILLLACAAVRDSSIAVLFLVFFQPCVLMYFIYWRHHRHDASLDMIIKLFSVGFWWTTAVSSLLEALLSLLLVVVLGFHPPAIESDDSQNAFDPTSPEAEEAIAEWEEETRAYYSTHMVKAIALNLLTAFLVAACVEETMKHFIVRCCQFKRSHQNQYSVIIYMVAGALGFATCENITYVFGGSIAGGTSGLSGFSGELLTLFLRVLMPIHPICAFIQGINTAKRDLDIENRHFKLWHILLPAIALHGTFDAVVMVLGTVSIVEGREADSLIGALTLSAALGISVVSLVAVRMSYKRREERLLSGWSELAMSPTRALSPDRVFEEQLPPNGDGTRAQELL